MSLKSKQVSAGGLFVCLVVFFLLVSCLFELFVFMSLSHFKRLLDFGARLATQIASGVESGAVDPFAGVSLMEEYIRDANRFLKNVHCSSCAC